MKKNRPLQLEFVDRVSDQVITWAKESNISLHKIETIVPFVTSEKDLTVWLFFDTERVVKRHKKNGTVEEVKKAYLCALEDFGYPNDYLDKVSFHIDSHENVVKNFEGSYFYRLR